MLIQSVYQEYMAEFSFKNAVNHMRKKAESTSVGIQSIQNMMKKMGGICNVWQSWESEEHFKIEVLFLRFLLCIGAVFLQLLLDLTVNTQ